MDACRYNGVKLPVLPAWNTAAYPYACIQYVPYRAGGFIAHLRCSSQPFRRTGGVITNLPGAVIRVRSFMDRDAEYEWDLGYTAAGLELNLEPDSVIWCNSDIPDENGETFLAASEPAPVRAVTIPDFCLFNWLVGFAIGMAGGPAETQGEGA